MRAREWRLSTVLTISSVALVLLSLIPVAAINALETSDLLRDRGQERLLHFALKSADHIDDHFTTLLKWGRNHADRPGLMRWLSGGPAPDDPARAAWEADVLRPFQLLFGLPGVLVASPDGHVLLRVGHVDLPEELPGWPPFLEATAGRDGLSDVLFGPTGARAFVLSAIRSPSGEIVAVVVVEDDLTVVREILTADSDAEGPDSFGFLLDDHVIRLLDSSNSAREGMPLEPLPRDTFEELAREGRVAPGLEWPALRLPENALGPQLSRVRRERLTHAFARHADPATGAVGYGVIVPIRLKPWVYYMGAPGEYFNGPARAQFLRAASTAAGMLALAALGAVAFARRVSRPVRQLAEVVVAQGLGQKVGRAPVRGPREIADLAAAFNTMLDRVNASSEDLERQVSERTADLEASNRDLEMFSYSASHDLRSPLRTIGAFTDSIIEDLGPTLPADAREDLLRIRRAVSRMNDLIDKLLDLGRIHRRALTLETVDLGAIAQSLIEEMRRLEPNRNVELTCVGDLVVQADAGLMEIALANLLGNAWKFSSVRKVAHIELGGRSVGGTREFYVRDDGAGFDSDHAADLFQPFRRLHSAQEFAGTGLGLSIVRRVIERHGGQIHGQSAPDRGATFTFTLGPQASGSAPNPEGR